MKKYVIIAGVPRAGKSTISKRNAKQKGYQHISMDAILAGIEKISRSVKLIRMNQRMH